MRVLLVLVLAPSLVGSALAPITRSVRVGKVDFSPIGCGTWAWGNRLLWGYSRDDDPQLARAFDAAVQKGVTWFDTADSYGTGALSGRAEELLGQFEAQSTYLRQKRKRINVCTKLAPYPWRIGEASMEAACAESVGRLRRPVDVLQLHWPPTLRWQESSYLSALDKLVQQGQATQLGLSNYGPNNLKRVLDMTSGSSSRILSNQVQFSLLSRYPLTNGLAEVCEERGVRLIGYSPLALGLLTDKYSLDRLPSGPRALLFREYLPSMQSLLGEMREVARLRSKTVAQVALNWNLQKGLLVLVGMRTEEQVADNMGALGWALSTPEIEAIDKAASKAKQLVQNSFQNG